RLSRDSSPSRLCGVLMRRLCTLFGSCLVLFVASAWATQIPYALDVVAENVNLRSCAGGECEVGAQAARGARLNPTGLRDGDWLEAAAPPEVIVWVYAELVTDGICTVEGIRVRGGPGINYRSVGSVAKGDRVTVLGQDGDWLRIAPPPGCTLWVNTQYVQA